MTYYSTGTRCSRAIYELGVSKTNQPGLSRTIIDDSSRADIAMYMVQLVQKL